MTTPAPRVLVVASWYPSHDSPGRGSFVSDQVDAALVRAGLDVVVASSEPLRWSGQDYPGAAIAPFIAAIERSLPIATPASWGSRAGRPAAVGHAGG